MLTSTTITASINRPVDEVYEFIRTYENLPRWASGIGQNLRHVDARWIIDMSDGPVEIEFAARNTLGVLDHVVTTTNGQSFLNPMRAVANDVGTDVMFTVFQFAGVTTEQYAVDVQTVTQDLRQLKSILEAERP